MDKKIGFVGGGNMGEAIIKGLIQAKMVSPQQIFVCDIRRERTAYLHEHYHVNISENLLDLTADSEVIILAVKPQDIASVLEEMKDKLGPNHLLISIAAGISTTYIESFLPEGVALIRVMPNTPALVLEGMSALTPGRYATQRHLELAESLFKAIGKTVIVPEKLMDAVTGLSGSGPAYVAVMIEALADGGVKMGLPRPIASKLAMQTVLGTAKLLLETGMHPAQLKDMVSSPGGTTIAGLHIIEIGGVRGILMEAIERATQRSQELGG